MTLVKEFLYIFIASLASLHILIRGLLLVLLVYKKEIFFVVNIYVKLKVKLLVIIEGL
jgi:hypothetical protein